MLEALRRRASRFGLDVVLIDVWEGAQGAREAGRYCDIWNIEGAVLVDETAAFARSIGIRGVPTNVFVDERGIVRGVGATTTAGLLRFARELCPELPADDGHGDGGNPLAGWTA